jgi:8-oxo-dGTP diphosphatase
MIIRNSAKAIVVHMGRLLVTAMEDKDVAFCLLPGGTQEPGETLDKTVVRECLEETGYRVLIGDLLFIREDFLEEGVHRVEHMFQCTLADATQKPAIPTQPDTNQRGVEWLEVERLEDLPLYPKEIRFRIKEWLADKVGLGYLGVIK